MPNSPATLTFATALDEGDPKNEVPHRDEVFTWNAPFAEEPVSVGKTEYRSGGLQWIEGGSQAVLT